MLMMLLLFLAMDDSPSIWAITSTVWLATHMHICICVSHYHDCCITGCLKVETWEADSKHHVTDV